MAVVVVVLDVVIVVAVVIVAAAGRPVLRPARQSLIFRHAISASERHC